MYVLEKKKKVISSSEPDTLQLQSFYTIAPIFCRQHYLLWFYTSMSRNRISFSTSSQHYLPLIPFGSGSSQLAASCWQVSLKHWS